MAIESQNWFSGLHMEQINCQPRKGHVFTRALSSKMDEFNKRHKTQAYWSWARCATYLFRS